MSQSDKSQKANKGWYIALIILSAITVLSLLTTFIFINMLPSEVKILIEKTGTTVSIIGGLGVFVVLFQLYFKAYTKIFQMFLVMVIISVAGFGAWFTMSDKPVQRWYPITAAEDRDSMQSTPLSREPEIDPSMVTVRTTRNVDVFVGERFLGKANELLLLEPGRHNIQLRVTGSETLFVDIELAELSENTIIIEEDKNGRLVTRIEKEYIPAFAPKN